MSVAAKKGLGTGLDVLFGESIKEEKPPEGVSKLPIAKVEPRDNQPRSCLLYTSRPDENIFLSARTFSPPRLPMQCGQ